MTFERITVDADKMAGPLTKAGHDSVHTSDVVLSLASDTTVLEHADREGRVILSADTDFGTLLARRRSTARR